MSWTFELDFRVGFSSWIFELDLSWTFELDFQVGFSSWISELDFRVGLSTELDFRVGLSSWTFELDFRVWISSWTFQQEASADVTADLDTSPPFFSISKTDRNHVQTWNREIFSAMFAVK